MLNALLALPGWMKTGIAAIAVVAVLQVSHVSETRGLHRQLAAAAAERDRALVQVGELRQAVAEVQVNRDTLAARLREQGAAIDVWQARAKQAESSASLAAARALATGRAASEALRAPASTVPPGHEAMNAWLRSQLRGAE